MRFYCHPVLILGYWGRLITRTKKSKYGGSRYNTSLITSESSYFVSLQNVFVSILVAISTYLFTIITTRTLCNYRFWRLLSILLWPYPKWNRNRLILLKIKYHELRVLSFL